MTDRGAETKRRRRRGPIVEKIRALRQEHARKFDYDPEAIFEDLERYQEESEREAVSFPPKRLERTEGAV